MRNIYGTIRRGASRRFGDLPLRRKYLFSHVSVVLLTVAVLSSASYWIARNQVEARVGEFSSSVLQKSAILWDAKVGEIADYFIAQFEAFNLGSYLRADAPGGASPAKFRVEQFLTNIITYKDGIKFILIESADGGLYFGERERERYGREELRSLIPHDLVRSIRARPFFQTIPDGTIVLSKVIYDLRNTEYLGILSVGFDRSTFSVVFPDADKAALGFLMIVDDKVGEPVVSSPGAEALVAAWDPAVPRHQRIDGTPYLVDEVRGADGRWRFLSYTALPAIANLSGYAGLFILIASAAAIAAAAALSVVLSGRETARILRIKGYADRIAAGDLSGHSSDSHADELGKLSRTLEGLSRRISSLVEGLASEKARLNEIRFSSLRFEYSALQSKMNPHFLYNALEMINASAKLKGCREVSESIQVLGDLMRDNLRGGDKLIPLREELEYIRKYLRIQRILSEDGLETRFDLDAAAAGCPVPKLLLQPIVENAIVHGLEPRGGRGTVSVSASVSGGLLTIRVSDDGVGMDEDRIRAALSRGEEDADGPHAGLGLASVDRRIRIVYGEGFGLRIESSPGAGTCVMVALPAEGDAGT